MGWGWVCVYKHQSSMVPQAVFTANNWRHWDEGVHRWRWYEWKCWYWDGRHFCAVRNTFFCVYMHGLNHHTSDIVVVLVITPFFQGFADLLATTAFIPKISGYLVTTLWLLNPELSNCAQLAIDGYEEYHQRTVHPAPVPSVYHSGSILSPFTQLWEEYLLDMRA